MVIRTMELLFEYMSFILCIHKIAKEKVKINIWIIGLFLIELVVTMCSSIGVMPNGCRVIVFGGIFLYTKIKVVGTWKRAVNTCSMMLIVIMVMQVIQYYLLSFCPKEALMVKYAGIIVNLNVCLLILLWRDKYKNVIMGKLNKVKNVVIFLLLLAIILYLLIQNAYVDIGLTMQFLFETFGLCTVFALWISAEKEKKHKLRELQMYEMYNQAFEEAIVTIRTRQHEFENHINAIKCMQYTIASHEELMLAQEQYCEEILKENKLNRLLKLNIEPVLVGFLYSKMTFAEEKNVDIKYEIQPVDIKEKIAIYEFIEVIGILFDNAVEALTEKKCKKIIVKLLIDEEHSFSLEIANCSTIYTNSEIEKFSTYGYSTKGEKRGIGLSRVKEISKKYNAIYRIQNCLYDGENYLSFKLIFD